MFYFFTYICATNYSAIKMKHTSTTLFLLFYFCFSISAKYNPEPNLKYGKPSDEELNMKIYEPDTTATAIILYDIGKSNYRYTSNEFSLITQHSVKIKILKPEGKQYADVAIPYYSPEQHQENREAIYDLEACAYNLENGKQVKTSTKNDFIVRERIDKNYMQLKFSIPSVREGTVIEYRYKQASDYYLQLEDWTMQTEIPVVYSEYSILIPNIFVFNIEMQGKEYIEVTEKEGSYSVEHNVGSDRLSPVKHNISLKARQLTFTAHNLPALPENEKFIWCTNDYKVNISFELHGVQEGDKYKSYTQTWEDIDNYLLSEKSEYFGQRLTIANPYRKEMLELQLSALSTEEKIITLFHLLKQKMTWNGEYRLYSQNPQKAISTGTGNNADLNFVFLSMLRECGIKAWPVVLRQRNMGRLPIHYPSLQKLNTFIVAIRTNEGKIVYLDSSMKDAYLDMLPETLTVEKARIINNEAGQEKWVDLTQLANNTTRITINSTLTSEGIIKGTQESIYTGHPAVTHIVRYEQAKDSIDFIKQYQDKNGYYITGFEWKEINIAKANAHEKIQFERKADNANEHFLYINPILLTHIDKNPFIQSERVMPIDLPHKYTYNITNTFTLPQGYGVEEIPKSQAFTTEDNGINCRYYIQQNGNKIILRYVFVIRQLHFAPAEYPYLQALWTAATEKNNTFIVLKKL